MYKCVVLENTDERLTPDIRGEKTGVTYRKETSYRVADEWTTEYYNEVNAQEAWVGTPGGYTAQRYPRLINSPKVYVLVTEVGTEPPTSTPYTTFELTGNSDGTYVIKDFQRPE